MPIFSTSKRDAELIRYSTEVIDRSWELLRASAPLVPRNLTMDEADHSERAGGADSPDQQRPGAHPAQQ
jgi:hypothetical protein